MQPTSIITNKSPIGAPHTRWGTYWIDFKQCRDFSIYKNIDWHKYEIFLKPVSSGSAFYKCTILGIRTSVSGQRQNFTLLTKPSTIQSSYYPNVLLQRSTGRTLNEKNRAISRDLRKASFYRLCSAKLRPSKSSCSESGTSCSVSAYGSYPRYAAALAEAIPCSKPHHQNNIYSRTRVASDRKKLKLPTHMFHLFVISHRLWQLAASSSEAVL